MIADPLRSRSRIIEDKSVIQIRRMNDEPEFAQTSGPVKNERTATNERMKENDLEHYLLSIGTLDTSRGGSSKAPESHGVL